MKYSFNFLQVANWVYVIRTKLKIFRERLDKETITADEAIKTLEAQKKQLKLIKEIMMKKTKLIGIQKDFLRDLSKIKKEYGLDE